MFSAHLRLRIVEGWQKPTNYISWLVVFLSISWFHCFFTRCLPYDTQNTGDIYPFFFWPTGCKNPIFFTLAMDYAGPVNIPRRPLPPPPTHRAGRPDLKLWTAVRLLLCPPHRIRSLRRTRTCSDTCADTFSGATSRSKHGSIGIGLEMQSKSRFSPPSIALPTTQFMNGQKVRIQFKLNQ